MLMPWKVTDAMEQKIEMNGMISLIERELLY